MSDLPIRYIYRCVQMPVGVALMKKWRGDECAKMLEEIINKEAQFGGWEFYRVDEFVTRIAPGCLGFLGGQREQNIVNYVVTFRRLL